MPFGGPKRHLGAVGPAADDETRRSAGVACTVVKHLKSNAVCLATPNRLLGAGAGQMDRVAACRIATEKASEALAEETDEPQEVESDDHVKTEYFDLEIAPEPPVHIEETGAFYLAVTTTLAVATSALLF